MKNFPKKVDSKTRYLRIEIPENLDLVLEGLIRKVLREQPDMENIYSFAAEYFESLIRIREQTGIKHSSNQIFSSSSDEDVLQMVKLANTFQKPVHEKFFSLKNSTENQKLEKPEQKIKKTLPNAKESFDKKSNNHKLKFSNKSADLTMSNKKSENDNNENESITKVIDSKKSNTSDHKVLRKNQDNETVVKNKEHVGKHVEEKIDKLQEEYVLKSAEINENVEAKGNNQVLNGIRETCQVIQETTTNSFLDNAEEENLKENPEKVISNKNVESEEYENAKKSNVFYENEEDKISNLEKNSDVEKKKKDKIEELQSNEEPSKASEENKQDKKGFSTENEEIRERNDKEARTPNEETSIKNNNNEEIKEESVNSGKSLENRNSEEIKIEEEKDVGKNELNKNKLTTLPEENKTENKSVEQILMSKNAGEILNFELVPSSPLESMFSNEKKDKGEKSEGQSVNVTNDVNCSVSENKLKVPDSLINEIKEDLLLKNNEVISKEKDEFCLNEQNPSVKKTDNFGSETQSEETEIIKEESVLKKSEEKDLIMSWPEKEEENIESEVMKEKEIDKNSDFLNASNAEMVERKSETDVKLCLKAEEEEERRESDSLNLEVEINERIQNNLEKNGEELTPVKNVGNKADNDIKNRVFDGEDIIKTDDINDSYVNKKSFFKTLTDSVKELDDEKLQVSDHSKEEIFSTAVEEENSKKEADIEILNNFNESKEYSSDETNVITKLENERERKRSEEKKENQESDAKNIKKNNDQKEEKEVGGFYIHHDSSMNQKTEELGHIEKNDDGEELCTVVDAFVLNTLKPKEDEENKEWNNQKNNKEAETLVERKIKTIETHYYDLLKVPEIVKKEYRVHHTEEKLPQMHTNQNERNSEFIEEEKVKNKMTLEEENPKDSQPNEENKFFLFNSALNSEETPLGDPLRANEIFLKREKHYSSMEKMIAKAAAEENKEDKVVVTEIVEKRRIFEAGAVPLEPRDEEELKNQNLQTSENAKEEKHDKCKSSTEGSESDNYEPNASISAGSKSLDIDAAIISVDAKTVAEEQGKKEGDGEEKVSGEISESAIDNSAPQSTPKKLLRGDETERDDTETKERREIEKKKLSRSCSQTLMKSEGLMEKKKRNSLAAIRQESRDEDIWGTIEKELQMAATKIQSKFRGYSTRKKLRREDAVQSSTEEPSGSEPLVEEAEDGGCRSTGEFHDSIVLSVHPR